MNKRILALVLTSVLLVGSTISASATPDTATLNESRQKYAEIEAKIADIQDEIYDLNEEMEPLEVKVVENKKEVENINNVIENTEKNIENCKKEITELDEALGERVKAMYTSGNLEFSYLTFIFESESTADFFGRIQSVAKIVGKDKEAIDSVVSKKEELDNQIETLTEKKEEISKLSEEIETSLQELEVKKKEQEVLIKEAQEEKEKFDAEYLSELEREVVQTQFNVIKSSSSTSSQINDAITQLRSIRDSQLKSQTIIAEVNEMIEKGKTAYAQKKQAEEEAAAAVVPNRGNSSSSGTSGTGTSGSTSNSVTTPTVSSGNAQSILNEAYKHLGKAYVFGATGPSNFDCSGFTQYVYRVAAGIDITRTTYTQINMGVAVSQANLQPGDLVFPHTGHVGIYIGNGQMIHAPQTGDVIKVSSVYKFYTARRIL